MSKATSHSVLLVSFTALLVGCSGGMSSPNQPVAPNMVQASLTIHDNPPTGVTVLSFDIDVTGAELQPSTSNPSQQPVSMLSEPEDIELEHLQTQSALLASKSVPTGMYSSLMVSFANPHMTIQNQTTTTYTLGGQKCIPQQICEFNPTLNQSSVTLAGSPPFPLTLTMNSPVVLKMDFNVDTSVQNDLSITPTVSVVQVPTTNSGGQQGEEDIEVVGTVSSMPDQTAHTFMIQTGMNGPIFTIMTDSNTQFDFGTTCSMNNFSCLQKGQIVEVEAKMQADGSLLAFEVKLFQPPNEISFAGTITSVSSTSFQIVLFDEEAFGGEMGSFSMGIPLTINLATSPSFTIDSDGFMLPSGLNFGGPGDLMVGQRVRLHPTGLPTGMPPNVMVTVDQVQLEPSEVTGTITATSPPSFTLGTLPSFFTNAGITSIKVDVLSNTQFETEEDQMMSGLSSVQTGETVSVRGLLFGPMTAPTMAAEKVVNRSMSSGTSD